MQNYLVKNITHDNPVRRQSDNEWIYTFKVNDIWYLTIFSSLWPDESK